MTDVLETGWTPSLDIPTALHAVPSDDAFARYVLVSMIDSTPKVRELLSLVPLLKELGVFYAEVDDDVVIELPTLFALADEHNFLSGFDEVWLCTNVPASGKPTRFRITSDVPFGAEPPAGLAEWMLRSSCVAGLGDGDGLNFATFDPQLAAVWSR
jgi:hypothetical protein